MGPEICYIIIIVTINNHREKCLETVKLETKQMFSKFIVNILDKKSFRKIYLFFYLRLYFP